MNLKIAILSVLTSLIFLSAHAQTNSYTVIPIVNNVEDSFLVNPWGLSRPNDPNLGENQWWVSDNATGFTTLYDAGKSGINALAPLFISIPTASGTGIGSPTGQFTTGPRGLVREYIISPLPRWTERFRIGMQARNRAREGQDALAATSPRPRSR